MEKRKKRGFKRLLILQCLLAIIFLSHQAVLSADLKKVIMAEGMQPSGAPIYVASEKGFWKEEGLDVDLKPFTMGRLCMDAVLGGRADAGFVAELPPVLVAFKDQPFRLVAAMESDLNSMKVLVRKDRGITKPSDLVGKKVACSLGTTSDYFLSTFLQAKGVDRKQLKVMNLSATDMVTAIVQGEVEAIFTWEPPITNAKGMLGDKAEVWFGGGIYRNVIFLGIMEDYIKNNPKVVKGLLKGLIKAEEFIKQKPDEAIRITSPRVNMNREALKGIWEYNEFRICLEKKYLDLMNGEARWAIETGIAPSGSKMPDIRKLFYTDILKAIDPSRVDM